MNPIYPLTFKPVYKDYPWGGCRIPETFGRNVPEGIYAESWEISDRSDGMSVVSNGPLAGKTLREVVEADPAGILGNSVQGDRFPLLIKLIDAKQTLSVQVHPNDATARLTGGEAKTEMWYLLGENPAKVYCGFKEGVDRNGFLNSINEGTCAQTLRDIPVNMGDVVLVRGGRVHAIDAGCLLLEIQQNSNTTYRIHDWGRMGNDGKPRELHVEQALQVVDWDDRYNPLPTPRKTLDTDSLKCWKIVSCDHFHVEKLEVFDRSDAFMDGTTFHALFVSEGCMEMEWPEGAMQIGAGTSVLVPASLEYYSMDGTAVVLRIMVPG